jgi:acyl-coenzyme A synthetase/AMP-(fatty) acid ligase
MTTLPILNNLSPDTAIFWYKDEVITHEKFMSDVLLIAANLKKHSYAINLCEDRYLFALGFVACMQQKQICLMPASRAEKEIETLEEDYEDTHRIDDALIESLLACEPSNEISFPSEISSEQLVAIVFTSGSSGKPKANLKHWGTLVDSAQRVATQLNFNNPTQYTIIATVPPQHMYGFETTIIFPLVTGVCVHNSKPFFPDDIRQTINLVTSPVILVTTPIHLRACTQTHLEWPSIDFALCATAPLSAQLAEEAEQQLQATVHEFYGCSEAGVIATRTTTQNSDWTLLPEYKFSEKLTGVCLITPLTNEEILLPDQIEKIDSQHFRLLGRQSDLVKIAGKRGSLNDLKIKLCAMDGVNDAVFFMPDENPDEKARLAAFVVAPNLTLKEINSFFSQQVDHAFVPRPLILVEKIPYNETGKLPRKNLINLFKQYRNNKHLKDSA